MDLTQIAEARGSDQRAPPKAFWSSSHGHSPPEQRPRCSHGCFACQVSHGRPGHLSRASPVWKVPVHARATEIKMADMKDSHTWLGLALARITPGGATMGDHGGSPPSVLGPVARTLPYPEPHSQCEAVVSPFLQLVRRWAGPAWSSGFWAILSASRCPSAPLRWTSQSLINSFYERSGRAKNTPPPAADGRHLLSIANVKSRRGITSAEMPGRHM